MEFFHPTFTCFLGGPRCNSGQICIILKPEWGRTPFLNHSFTVTSAVWSLQFEQVIAGRFPSHLYRTSINYVFLICCFGARPTPYERDSYVGGDLYPNHQPFKITNETISWNTFAQTLGKSRWFPQNLPSGSRLPSQTESSPLTEVTWRLTGTRGVPWRPKSLWKGSLAGTKMRLGFGIAGG